jgi:hypothetical protein
MTEVQQLTRPDPPASAEDIDTLLSADPDLAIAELEALIADTERRLASGLAWARVRKGLSQKQFSRRVRFSRSTIGMCEVGRSLGSPEFWQVVDSALEVGGALVKLRTLHDKLTGALKTTRSRAHRAQAETEIEQLLPPPIAAGGQATTDRCPHCRAVAGQRWPETDQYTGAPR